MNMHHVSRGSTSFVDVARSLQPLLAQHAAQTERDRRVPDSVIEAIADAGLFQMVKPRRAGGGGATQLEMLEALAELAKGCMSTAWVTGLIAGVTGLAGCMPPAIRDTIFATGDERVFGVTTPTGEARRADRGYLVSGRWGYASGSLHADWGVLGVRLREAERAAPKIAFIFFPLDAAGVSIIDTWHVAGVAGSGSNTVALENVFVPEHMVFDPAAPGRNDWLPTDLVEPRDRWLDEVSVPLGVIAPSIGAVEAMADLVTASVDKKTVTHWKYPVQSDSEVLLEELGRARMEIESAWLHVGRAAAVNDELAQTRCVTGREKARAQADCGYATILMRSAADRLMDIAGSSAFASANPLQRFWRDVNVGTRHAFLNAHASMELYGRVWTGKESNNVQFNYADAQ